MSRGILRRSIESLKAPFTTRTTEPSQQLEQAKNDAEFAKVVSTAVAVTSVAILLLTSFGFTVGMAAIGITTHDAWQWSVTVLSIEEHEFSGPYYMNDEFMKKALENTFVLKRLYDNPLGKQAVAWLGRRYATST